MELIESLNWRYAVKKMTGAKVPDEKLERILDATLLSASSMGLQPYTVLVVSDPEVKKNMLPAANGQSQMVDSSHVLVFAVWEDISEERLNSYVDRAEKERGLESGSMQGYKNSVLRYTLGKDVAERREWFTRQAYIALGTAIIAAATEQVDATPMEGFDPQKMDEVLQLKEKGLRSVVLLALGYRSEDDKYSRLKKVRRDKDEVFVRI